MPDVPDPDFVGALCEIWATINYAAYHLAYVQVYLQTAALQTHIDEMHRQDQAFRDVSRSTCMFVAHISRPSSGKSTMSSRHCGSRLTGDRKNTPK
jgi:hypothetical protein